MGIREIRPSIRLPVIEHRNHVEPMTDLIWASKCEFARHILETTSYEWVRQNGNRTLGETDVVFSVRFRRPVRTTAPGRAVNFSRLVGRVARNLVNTRTCGEWRARNKTAKGRRKKKRKKKSHAESCARGETTSPDGHSSSLPSPCRCKNRYYRGGVVRRIIPFSFRIIREKTRKIYAGTGVFIAVNLVAGNRFRIAYGVCVVSRAGPSKTVTDVTYTTTIIAIIIIILSYYYCASSTIIYYLYCARTGENYIFYMYTGCIIPS